MLVEMLYRSEQGREASQAPNLVSLWLTLLVLVYQIIEFLLAWLALIEEKKSHPKVALEYDLKEESERLEEHRGVGGAVR